MNHFAATVVGCVQVGVDLWRNVHTTKVFPMTATMSEVLAWAKETAFKNTDPDVSDVTFSIVSEEAQS